jgi:uncharacterized Zn-binding protein involved in type VI secretion
MGNGNLTPMVRLNDPSDHGGKMITATAVNLKADGIAVCVHGDFHDCPIPGHGITPVSSSSSVKSGGKPIIHVGHKARCGASISQGSPKSKNDG